MACRDDVRCWACRTIMHFVFSVGDLSESRRQGLEAILLASLSRDHVLSSRMHIELMANCVRFNLTAAFSTAGAQSCTCLRAIIKTVFLATSPVIPSDPFTPTHRHESFVFAPNLGRRGLAFGTTSPPFIATDLVRLTVYSTIYCSLLMEVILCYIWLDLSKLTSNVFLSLRCYREHYVRGPGRGI